MYLKSILYYGEDERREISIIEAISLLGEDVVKDIYNSKDCRSHPVDADYYIRFVWRRENEKTFNL